MRAVRSPEGFEFVRYCAHLDRPAIIVTFLAVLELIRAGRVGLRTGRTRWDAQALCANEATRTVTTCQQPELIDTGELEREIEALLFVASESLSIDRLAKLTGVFPHGRRRNTPANHRTVRVARDRRSRDRRRLSLREFAPSVRAQSSKRICCRRRPISRRRRWKRWRSSRICSPSRKPRSKLLRGVNVDSVVSTLLDRRFIVEAGRRDVVGRPIIYKTTPEFLESFGLRSISELPPVDMEAESREIPLPDSGRDRRSCRRIGSRAERRSGRTRARCTAKSRLIEPADAFRRARPRRRRIRDAVAYAARMGCTAVQFFNGNPKSYRLDAADVPALERFRSLRQEAGIDPAVIHTSYLINLASEDPKILRARCGCSRATWRRPASAEYRS